MTEISREMIHKVAKLARLEIPESQVAGYQEELSAILTYIDRLQELDLDDGSAGENPEKVFAPERTDEVVSKIPVEESLKNAPRKVGTAFQVPKIIE